MSYPPRLWLSLSGYLFDGLLSNPDILLDQYDSVYQGPSVYLSERDRHLTCRLPDPCLAPSQSRSSSGFVTPPTSPESMSPSPPGAYSASSTSARPTSNDLKGSSSKEHHLSEPVFYEYSGLDQFQLSATNRESDCCKHVTDSSSIKLRDLLSVGTLSTTTRA